VEATATAVILISPVEMAGKKADAVLGYAITVQAAQQHLEDTHGMLCTTAVLMLVAVGADYSPVVAAQDYFLVVANAVSAKAEAHQV